MAFPSEGPPVGAAFNRSAVIMWDSILTFFSGSNAYWALFLSAFTSSTVLPGSSEAVLAASWLSGAHDDVERLVLLCLTATLGNTLGGMTGWALGRFVPERTGAGAALDRVRKWGSAALFFAWVPVLGDAVPVAAGWLRIPFWRSFWIMGLGRACRYAFLGFLLFKGIELWN